MNNLVLFKEHCNPINHVLILITARVDPVHVPPDLEDAPGLELQDNRAHAGPHGLRQGTVHTFTDDFV